MSDRLMIGVKCGTCERDFGVPDTQYPRRHYARIRGHFVLCTAWRYGEGLMKEYPLVYYRTIVRE